jgi:glycosyltransferase involved in cell wall biosynthesis
MLLCAALHVCTIIAKNYIAHARVLARSLARHHPGDRLWTLIIDDFSRYVDPADVPFEVLTPADIGCDEFTHMALRYSVLELSTAVKPWLLRHLMQRTGGPVTYLDPDIEIHGSLQRLDELAAEHKVVLIPHNSRPIPPDGRKPSQVDIMIAGVYNLGYVSVAPSPGVDHLLDWWAERLVRDCRVDPQWGYFVDQRWFDLAPGFLTDFAIVRDPEYNVAYWNLHDRRLEHDGTRYLVEGRPLAFFHFSGFDAAHPLVLSRYQNRIDVAAHPALERILGEYSRSVLAEGHAASRSWPYTYTSLGDGTRLDETLRRMYDDFAEEYAGAPSPFTLAGAKQFESWLKEQAPGAPPGINRVLHRVYRDRPDLRSAFPDLAGTDRSKLLAWVQEYGAREAPQLATLMTSTNGSSHGAQQPPPSTRADEAAGEEPRLLSEDPLGVNVVGYFRSEVGTGEAARQIVAALDTKGIPVLPIHGQTVPVSRQGHTYATAAPEDAAYRVNLICMNADMLSEFAQQAGARFFAGRYSVGLWFWEISRFPERWRGSFSLLEEVWAPTAHVAAALEPVATVPVHTIRVPIQPPQVSSRSRADLSLPEGQFMFLFSFDYLSVFRRKNPLATIEAFRRAFAPGDGAKLVLKCINQDRDAESHAALRAAAAAHPDVEVIDRYLDPADNNSLTALCDCYVSLHRAEGLGLVMAEAMLLGKPVIATGYSGNLDFMTQSNSLLVEHRLVPIGPGAEPYPADADWAEPDVEHAATLMREVFDDRDRAAVLGAKAAEDVRRTHSPAAAGEIMYRRLESIRGSGRPRPTAPAPRERPPALAALPLRIRQGPSVAAIGPPRRLRVLIKKLLLRLMRPFTQYQQSVNNQLLASIEELNSAIDDLRAEAAAERAQLLAALREQDREREIG